jgi:flavin-binding protein dodecin
MFKLSKVLVAGAMVAFLVGCSSDDVDEAIDDVLNKDSVALSNLDQHAVTYKNANGGASHTDVYCPSGALGDNNSKDGTWVFAGPALTVTPDSGTAYTYLTTNSKLEKNTSYPTTTGETFKVTKISETVCL